MNLLPTVENLLKRGMSVSHGCLFYGMGLDNLMHLFKECMWSRGIWLLSSIGLRVDQLPFHSLWEWFQYLMDSRNFELLIQVVYIWWGIWFQRNQLVFGKVGLHPMQLLLMVDRIRLDFQSTAVSPESKHSVPTNMDRWCPPLNNFVKVNTDAAFLSQQSQVGLGVVLRRHDGVVVLSA